MCRLGPAAEKYPLLTALGGSRYLSSGEGEPPCCLWLREAGLPGVTTLSWASWWKASGLENGPKQACRVTSWLIVDERELS